MDADPHFWMPVTLSEGSYVKVMEKKGTDPATAAAHFKRMQAFKERVLAASPGMRFFGAVPTGQDMFWWDYGRLGLYLENNLLITEQSESAKALRYFLRAVPTVQESEVGPVSVSPGACVLGCSFRGGTIGPRAVLVNVKAPYVDVDDCVLVNVTSCRPISGKKGGVLYNVADGNSAGALNCGDGVVRADVFVPEKGGSRSAGAKQIQVRSRLDIDGGKAWKEKVESNDYSFEEVHKMNKEVNVIAAQEEAARAHAALRS